MIFNNNMACNILRDYWLVSSLFVLAASAAILGDECDWTGSGLSTSSMSRGVTPVYLRCTAGRVTWMYPRGALRVLLRLPGQDREFRACIKVHPDGGKDYPARLFLEGPRSLLQLYSHVDGGPRPVRCFNSKNGQAAIYVEATDFDSVNKRVAEIEYDLQPFPRNARGYDRSEECRPCTPEEMAQAFCTTDLVTRGIIRGIENLDDLETTEMSIHITKLIRHTAEDDLLLTTNSLDPDEIVLEVPLHCGVSHGTGEFVFMARRKLGALRLQCAPRLEEWASLVNSLSKEDKAHCVLRS